MNKIYMVSEGDMGCEYKVIEDINYIKFIEELIEIENVLVMSKEECLEEFKKLVNNYDGIEVDSSILKKVNKMICKLNKIEEDGKWFCGDNGEYEVMVGCIV